MPRKKPKIQEFVEEEEDTDFYNIREDWNTLNALMEKMQPDLERFLKKRGKRASIRFRNGLSKIKHLALRLREGVVFQRRDNYSEFF